jgi:tRNA(Ile)-lysidine synthase
VTMLSTIRGLRGITPVNGRIVRPMLEVSRAEILSYLQAIGQDYVTDSTNLETDFTRNKIRLKVLPLLGEINPSVSDAIFETASRLVDVEEVYRKAIQEACRRVSVSEREVSIPALLGETAPRAILFELYAPLGFNASQLDNIYRNLQVKGMSGQLFYSPEYVLLRNRDSLVLEFREKPEK